MSVINLWPDVWDDQRRIAVDVWPEIGQNFRSYVMRRLNWTNLSSIGDLKMPYMVLHGLPARQSDQWGMNNLVFDLVISVYYICENDGQGTQNFIESKLSDYMDRLLQPDDLLQFTQVIDDFVIDVTEDNPVNQVQLLADVPYMGGSLTFRALTGRLLVTP